MGLRTGALIGGTLLGGATAIDNFTDKRLKDQPISTKLKNIAKGTSTGAGVGALAGGLLSIRKFPIVPITPKKKPKYPKGC